jgi:pimeloyl-ACP methyl ester carboxylesterase
MGRRAGGELPRDRRRLSARHGEDGRRAGPRLHSRHRRRGLEAILDAANVGRAAFVGYSYGGALAVQVACRSDRLSAVAVGGWPPLEAPFRRLAEIATELATDPPAELDLSREMLWSAAGFYGSLVEWAERDEVPEIDIPRLAFTGTDDEFDAPNPTLSDLLRRAEDDLRALGWEIAWIEGADHAGAMDARVSGPVVRAFLERALLQTAAAT